MLKLYPWASTLVIALFVTLRALAGDPISVTFKPSLSPFSVPDDFEGLSYETSSLIGGQVFNPQNTALINLFKTLGVRSLRLGGDTVDRANVPIPTHSDIDALFQFAEKSNVKVIYCVRLKDGKVDSAIDQADYIQTHYPTQLDCLAIGNEPNMYFKDYPAYSAAWLAIYKAITAADPQIKISGPGDWRIGWVSQFAKDPSYGANVTLLTDHEYPFGISTQVKNSADARLRMLSKNDYNSPAQQLAAASLLRGLPYRLEETNSYARGGTEGASNAYAASLWGLDYLCWWAAHHCGGVNFHTGSFNHQGKTGSFRYAAFAEAPEGGYAAMPLAYGMLAFKLGGSGQVLETDSPMSALSDPALRCYGVLAPDHSVTVTLINRSCDPTPRDLSVELNVSSLGNFTSVREMTLEGQKSDASIKAGITLGGASIQTNGNWNGQWTTLPINNGMIAATVPATSALILNFPHP